jgi:hypothetical protein
MVNGDILYPWLARQKYQLELEDRLQENADAEIISVVVGLCHVGKTYLTNRVFPKANFFTPDINLPVDFTRPQVSPGTLSFNGLDHNGSMTVLDEFGKYVTEARILLNHSEEQILQKLKDSREGGLVLITHPKIINPSLEEGVFNRLKSDLNIEYLYVPVPSGEDFLESLRWGVDAGKQGFDFYYKNITDNNLVMMRELCGGHPSLLFSDAFNFKHQILTTSYLRSYNTHSMHQHLSSFYDTIDLLLYGKDVSPKEFDPTQLQKLQQLGVVSTADKPAVRSLLFAWSVDLFNQLNDKGKGLLRDHYCAPTSYLEVRPFDEIYAAMCENGVIL